MGSLKKLSRFLFFSVALIGVEASAYAAPSISVSRTPSSGVEGTEYTVSWKSSGATKVWYQCSGMWNHSQSDISKDGLGLDGTVKWAYDAATLWSNYIGSTTCTWTATAADGSSSSASETFTVLPKSTTTQNSDEFKVTKVNGEVYTGTPVALSADVKSFVVEWVGAKDRNVAIGGGKIWANVRGNTDGTWSATITSGQYGAGFEFAKSGIMDFPMEAYGSYTASKTARFSVNIQGVASELSNESCRTISGDYSLPGAVMECSVSTKDPNTRFMINSGYTSWGDSPSIKIVQPVANTQIQGTYSNGVYIARITLNYHGYSLQQMAWFENSTGKSKTIDIYSHDPSSEDQRLAEAYLKKTYGTVSTDATNSSSSSTSTTSSTSTSNTNSSSNTSTTSSSISTTLANPTILFINGVTVSGPTMWRGLATGVIVTGNSISGYPISALSHFATQGSAPAGKKVRLSSSRSDVVFETDVNSIGRWWIDNSTQPDKVSALKTFLVSGENILTFKTYDPLTGKESTGFVFRIITPGTITSISTVSTQTSSSLSQGGNVNPYASSVSASMKTKLDDVVVFVQNKVLATKTEKAGATYLTELAGKLSTLAEKYKNNQKLANMYAVLYLEKEIEILNNNLFSTTKNTFMNNIESTY